MTDDAFEMYRDSFVLAFAAAGWGNQSACYDDGAIHSPLVREYFYHGWGPVEAMWNEIEGESREISDGPPNDET